MARLLCLFVCLGCQPPGAPNGADSTPMADAGGSDAKTRIGLAFASGTPTELQCEELFRRTTSYSNGSITDYGEWFAPVPDHTKLKAMRTCYAPRQDVCPTGATCTGITFAAPGYCDYGYWFREIKGEYYAWCGQVFYDDTGAIESDNRPRSVHAYY